MSEYFYYSRWTFKSPLDPNMGIGPFHSTFESSENPAEFLSGYSNQYSNNLSELLFKAFETKQEMEAYWLSVHPS